MRNGRTILILWTLLALGGFAARAQVESGSPFNPEAQKQLPVEVKAGRMEYDAVKGQWAGSSNATVTQGDATLRADYIWVNTRTQESFARGNVEFKRGTFLWSGEQLSYNFQTQTGDFGEFKAQLPPYYISAQTAKKRGPGLIEMEGVTISSCEDGFVQMKAQRANLESNRVLRAYNMVPYLGPAPFFYLPYWKFERQSRRRIDIVPGYSKNAGVFLLTGVRYPLTDEDWLDGMTHLDLRQKRGVGVGQDVLWNKPGEINGAAKVYYAQDNDPMLGDDVEIPVREQLNTQNRYRLSLDHYQTLDERDYAQIQLNYLSDPFVLEDFFSRDFDQNVQPQNYASLTRRGDEYTAGLLLSGRLNNFYDSVERLPQATLDFNQIPFFDDQFYYEGGNSLAYLRKVYPDLAQTEAYGSARLDSWHKVTYPTRNFGFLNVIPGVGYRATVYSRHPEYVPVTNYFTVTNTVVQNGVTNRQVSVTNSVSFLARDAGARFRNLFELSLDNSFKAFSVFGEDAESGRSYCHVIEPYANYKFVPEPNVTSDQLYQFDAVDQLSKQNYIQLGLRNLLLTKAGKQRTQLIDSDVYTYLNLAPDETMNRISPVYYWAQFDPLAGLEIKVDGHVNTYDNTDLELNTRVAYDYEEAALFSLEHRYRKELNSLLFAGITLFPKAKWSPMAGVRYDFEAQQFQEQMYGVQFRNQCIGVGVGVSVLQDDFKVWTQVWLSAFEGSAVGMGNNALQLGR